MMIDCFADEIVLLANRDDLEPNDKRVRIDTLKWLASKVLPQRYGERLLLAGDPANPIEHLHKQVSLDHLTADQLDMLERFSVRLLEARAVEHKAVG
jgi:hypothetical protein